MNIRLISFLLSFAVATAAVVTAAAPAFPAYDRAAAIAADIADGDGAAILVAAHRGDWRTAPENSLPAIESAIALGVDIVEIDVRRTKDGHFVLMHDTTIDRTTTGKGKVREHTLAELRELRLRHGHGAASSYTIPTLEEAIEAARGHAVLNLDKTDTPHIAEIVRIVERADALGFALFNLSRPCAEFEAAHPGLLARIRYMPVVSSRNPAPEKHIRDYLAHAAPPSVVQIVVSRDDAPVLGLIPEIRARGARVWINSLWPEHNGGHDDERAITDPDGAYGWLVKTGVNLIQTDRPALLIDWLRAHHLRR
jgi:glycerophosphoryl diester phosphodiesterase